MTKKKEVTIGFKGFNIDDEGLYCAPSGEKFRYKIGKTYKTDKTNCCSSGFHACPMPLSVFNYYAPAGNKFALVEQSGDLDKSDDKTSSTQLKIKAELSLFDLVKAQIEWVHNQLDPAQKDSVDGDQGAATQTGYQGAATQTGYQGAATQTGDQGAATQTGDQGAATQTGYQGAATQTGYQGAATQTGYQGAATQTGYRGAATQTGDQGAATQTGDQGAATQTGYQGAATQTGYQGAATQTGYRGAATQTGDQGAATQTGDRGAAQVKGDSSVAVAIGYESKAKASKGSCVVICDWYKDKNHDWHIKQIYSAKVGHKILNTKIEPDTWYWFEDGELKSEK